MGCVWIFLLYYVALLGGTAYNVLKIVRGDLSIMQMAAQVSPFAPPFGAFNALQIDAINETSNKIWISKSDPRHISEK